MRYSSLFRKPNLSIYQIFQNHCNPFAMESFLFQQHNQPFLLDCVYNYINQNGGDLSNNSPCYTTYTNNSSDANQDSSSSSLSTPQFSSEKKRKHSDHNSYSTTGQSKGVMGNKSKKKKQNGVQKKDIEEKKTKNDKELSATKAKKEEPKLGYIHVRARRGQATDSHSLAERVRRERISDRMKKLQDLVPGCDKVIGKALVLDEIINYVQSLQNQVEFLSMKLASANPVLYDFGGEFADHQMQQEEMGSISHSMPSVIQGSRIQTTAYEGAINSLQQAMYGQGPSTFPQDSGSILMQIGLGNTCYFQ